jgi:cytoskeletal protein CcmA (bactofilin family)
MTATSTSFPVHADVAPQAAGASAFGAGPTELTASRPAPPLLVVANTEPSEAGRAIAPANPELDQFIKDIDAEKVLLIPAGVRIKSDLESNGNAVVISGVVEGRINAGSAPVIVKQGGEVIGSIESDEYVVVAGTVTSVEKDGDAVVTKGLLILAATGTIKGTVAYGRQRAYEGGTLSGRAVPFAERGAAA